MKVLFIAGKGRAGSTLVDSMLGQVPGFTSTGEFFRFWEWGMKNGWSCGCGRPLPECEFWSEVLGRGFPGGSPDATEMTAVTAEVFSWKNVPKLLRAKPAEISRWPALERYMSVTESIFRAALEVSGDKVIVDSTKWPASPVALGLIPGAKVYVVQLVRDPRAVAYSWRQPKTWDDRPGEEEMPRFGPAYSGLSWTMRNGLTEVVARRHRPDRFALLRYEDLIADPRRAIETLVELVGEPPPDLGFLSDGSAVLEPTHTVGGNPNRLSTGNVPLKLDDRWRTEQPRVERWITNTLAFPLLGRYGYRMKL
jgi:hypothetical protein